MARVIRMEGRVQRTGSGILELVEVHHIGRLKRYKKGKMLYWQGDPAECVFVVRRGKVKVFSISLEGKTYIYDIPGAGCLVGATALLLGGEYESMAKAMEDTDTYVIPRAEFEHLLVSSSPFSMAVMRALAYTVRLLTRKAWEISFLDVRQRLKCYLVQMADQYGVATKEGVKIDLDITHEELAELIGAHRSTVTTYLNELEREGFLRKEGRYFILREDYGIHTPYSQGL